MKSSEAVRKFFGYVEFSARGGFSDRFLNNAESEGINIWDVRYEKGVMHGRTYIRGYRRIRHSAYMSGMSVRVERRVGLPFFLKRYNNRWGLLAGLVVFAAMLIYFSSMIWVVEVRGNENIPYDKVLETFADLGLKSGAKKSEIVPDDLQYIAEDEIDGLSWIVVNISGSVATIELREKIDVPEIVDRDDICNVVAAADGEIISISALTGWKSVKVGDGVVRGQMLISGVSQSERGNVYYRHAMGSVIARTQRILTAEIPLRREEIVYIDDVKHRYSLEILGSKIKFYFDSFDENYEKNQERSALTICGREYPFAFCSETYRMYEIREDVISIPAASASAKEEMEAMIEKLREEAEIEGIEYSLSYDDKVLTYVAKCTCIEDIAVQKKIEISDGTQENQNNFQPLPYN